MKRIFKRILQLATLTILGFGCFKGYEAFRENQISRLSAKKAVVQSEKPFVIIVVANNAAEHCQRNLLSILSQSYSNFRVIYINDNSVDDTFELAKKIEQASLYQDKITLISNKESKGTLLSLYDTIHQLDDDQIVVVVDGKDFLSHDLVLSKLNKIYSTSPTWLTYGNYLNYPSYKQKPSVCKPIAKRVIFNNSFRKQELSSFHLKTFYAGLFKMIRKEDLYYKGSLLPSQDDLAIMLPMLEMSGKHTRFIHDVMYLRNTKKQVNDKNAVELEQECSKYIRSLPKYKRLGLPSFASPTAVKNEKEL